MVNSIDGRLMRNLVPNATWYPCSAQIPLNSGPIHTPYEDEGAALEPTSTDHIGSIAFELRPSVPASTLTLIGASMYSYCGAACGQYKRVFEY